MMGRNLLTEDTNTGRNLLDDNIDQQKQPNGLPLSLRIPLRIGQDILAGAASAGQGIESAPYNIAKMLHAPQNVLQSRFMPQPTNIDMSSTFGVKDPNILDKIVQGVGQYAPLAIATMGASLPEQIGAGALYGATQSDRPLIGALGGAAAIGIPSGIWKGIQSGLVSKAIGAIRPQKYAKNIMDTISGGRSLSENATSIANDIKNAYNAASEESASLYKPIFSNYSKENIYKGIDSPQNYLSTVDKHGIYDKYLSELKDLHNNFMDNPTLDNAHSLQSRLGYEIRSLERADAKGTLTNVDKNTMQLYRKSRDALKNDMSSYLDNIDNTGMMSKLFHYSTDNYAKNVAPYTEDKIIARIANEDITNPKKIMSSIPSLLSSENINKIASDIGGDFGNKMIYSELGKTSGKAEDILKAANKLDQKGLTPFISDEFRQQMQSLSNKLRALKGVKWGAGIGAGLAAAHRIPIVKDII